MSYERYNSNQYKQQPMQCKVGYKKDLHVHIACGSNKRTVEYVVKITKSQEKNINLIAVTLLTTLVESSLSEKR